MKDDTTTTTTVTMAAALCAVAAQIDGWRQARHLSAVKLLRAYRGLGSTKTLQRLAAGQTEGLAVETWLPKYEAVWRLIQAARTTTAAETWDDLGPAYEAVKTVAGLMTVDDLNRLVIIEGDSGAGKTRALEAILARNPGMAVVIEADEAWKTKKAMVTLMLVGIGAAASVDDVTGDFMTRQARLIQALKSKRQLICLDESQHLTSEGLTVMKTLVSRTLCWFVMAGQNTLWKKLKLSAWQEAKQLIYNRCYASLFFGAPSDEDVRLFVQRRAGVETLKESTWKLMGDYAAEYGGFAFLRDVVTEAGRLMAVDEVPGDEELAAACEAIKRRAISR